MKVKNLVLSFYNVFLGATKIVLTDYATGKELFAGIVYDGFFNDFGEYEVDTFGVDEIKKTGVAKTLMIRVRKGS